MIKKINLPITDSDLLHLKSGDIIHLSGIIFTGRDQAHKKLVELLVENKEVPIDLERSVFYYTGPTPKGNRIIGSCGPTSSYRMDEYTPLLAEHGNIISIGKGERSPQIKSLCSKGKHLYISAIGGLGATYSNCVTSNEVVAFNELGTEAIRKIVIKDFPCVIAYDHHGNDLFLEKNDG